MNIEELVERIAALETRLDDLAVELEHRAIWLGNRLDGLAHFDAELERRLEDCRYDLERKVDDAIRDVERRIDR